MKILYNRLFVLLAVFFISQSCVHEISEYVPSNKEEEAEVVFTVRTPSGNIQTKALNGKEEDAVEKLQVMVFNSSDEGEYQYTAYAIPLDGSSGNGYIKYKVKLRTGTYDLMVFANSEEEINNYPGGWQKGMPRDGIIKNLQAQLQNKWNANSQGSGYKNIPMWAVKRNILINQNTDLMNDKGFQLIRLLARINIRLGLSEEQAGIFSLTSVRYHNRRTKGQLIPNQWNNVDTYVTTPSLVESDEGIEEALVYGAEYIVNEDSCKNEIYVFEAPKGDLDLHPKYPCLVVGGKYKGVEGYYRIDFATKNEETVNYYPILRNHTYDITILSVGGAGFVDPGDAYESLPVNIEASVVDWNEGMMGDMYFDGQNYLSIVKGTYELSAKAYTTAAAENTVYIKTDYKGGWEVDNIEYDVGSGTGWLSFEGGNKGNQNENSERWLKLLVNETENVRSATIPIVVGRIRGKIRVQQNTEQDLELTILDGNGDPIIDGQSILYNSNIWDSHVCNYTLNCYPAEAEIQVSLVNPVTGFEQMNFVNESEMLQQGILTGKETYPFGFQMKEFDMSETKKKGEFFFPEQAIEYQFTMKYEGKTLEKKFKVVNRLRDVQVTKLGGCLQGRFYDVELRYNTGFALTYDRAETDIMDPQVFYSSNISEHEEPGANGTQSFRMKLKIGSELDGREGALRFTLPGSPTKVFDQVDVISYYNHPNSFIVSPSGSKEFNVVKAFRMWESERIGKPLGNNPLSTNVIWMEKDMNISAVLNQKSDIRESTITVYGGGKPGNAVVGLFQDNEIVWSWHIWVTDFDPDNGGWISYTNGEGFGFTVMRRNLGANSDYLGENQESIGLYYQWGRKDPFPTCARNNGVPDYNLLGFGGNKAIVNLFGYYVESVLPPTAENSIIESIRRPDRFFRGMVEPYYDWYSHNGMRDDPTLWRPDDVLKSEFDPCPDGWRVPNYYVDKNNQHHYTFDFIMDANSQEYSSYGWTSSQVGVMPKSGYIDQDGYYLQVGRECWTWYGVYANDTGEGEEEDKRQGLADATWNGYTGVNRLRLKRPRSFGVPVRCEKDMERYRPEW